MSYRTRKRIQQEQYLASQNTDQSRMDDIVGTQMAYSTAVQDDPDNDNFLGTSALLYTDQYPGPREHYHPGDLGSAPMPVPIGYIKDLVDYEVEGVRGLVDNAPYSTGVVSSDLVENYWLDGSQAYIRRARSPQDRGGPVGTSDSNALLAIAYAQAVNQFYPNEASQADLVKSV